MTKKINPQDIDFLYFLGFYDHPRSGMCQYGGRYYWFNNTREEWKTIHGIMYCSEKFCLYEMNYNAICAFIELNNLWESYTGRSLKMTGDFRRSPCSLEPDLKDEHMDYYTDPKREELHIRRREGTLQNPVYHWYFTENCGEPDWGEDE